MTRLILLTLACALIYGLAMLASAGLRSSTLTSDLSQLSTTPMSGASSRPTQPPSIVNSQLSITPPPPSHIIPLRSHVYQTFNNCGPASLSMALSYYDIAVTQTELGERLRPYQDATGMTDDKSVTLTELAAEATSRGLVAYHRPGGSIELLRELISRGYPVIVRTWTTPTEDIGHYRVVRGYDDATGELIQDDSLQGKDLRYPYAYFLSMWRPYDYEYMVMISPDDTDVITRILGDDADESGAWRRSLARLSGELEVSPDDPQLLLSASVAAYRVGEYERSIKYYDSARPRLAPRALWYQIEPILSYYRVGRYDEVLTLISDIIASPNPAVSELYYLRAKIYEQRGDTDAAREQYRLATFYHVHYVQGE